MDTLRALAATVPALAAAAGFGILVSSLASSTGGAVAASLVPVTLFDLFQDLLQGSAPYVFVTWLPLLGEGSALARLTDVARAYADTGWEPGELLRGTWVPLVQGAAPEGCSFALRDEAGNPVPLQTSILAQWPDGSARPY